MTMIIEDQLPDFAGQTVAFYLLDSDNYPEWMSDGLALVEPTFQKQANRIFVCGKTVQGTDDSVPSWSDNRQAALAWESVVYYIAMPIDDYYETQKWDDGVEAVG